MVRTEVPRPQPTAPKIGQSSRGRVVVLYSTVRRYMQSLEDNLFMELRSAFKSVNLPLMESAVFTSDPDVELERIYRTCFGEHWGQNTVDLTRLGNLQSLDAFVALIGAAIYLKVFREQRRWETEDPVVFCSAEYKEHMTAYFDGLGKRPLLLSSRHTRRIWANETVSQAWTLNRS